MKAIFNYLLCLSLVTLTCVVNAQTNPSSTGNFYIGLDAGYSKVKDQSQVLADSLVSSIGGTASATESSNLAIGRIFGGYKIDDNFSVELGYLQSTNVNYSFSGVSRGNVAYSGTATGNVGGLDYSVLVRPSSDTGFNNVFFKIGGTYLKSSTDVTVTANTSATSSTSTSGSGYLLGIGYQNTLTDNLDYRVGYTYYGNNTGESGTYANVIYASLIGKF